MAVHRVEPGQEIPAPARGDTLLLQAGYHYGGISLLSPGVTIEGEPGAVLSGATTGTLNWTREPAGYWSTDMGFQPALLAINGQQVGQWHPDWMTQARDKHAGVTGFEALAKPDPWNIRTEWNGIGNFWDVMHGLWGYHSGRVYLRLKGDGDPNELPIEGSPSRVGLVLAGDCVVRDLELRLFSTSIIIDGTDNNALDNVTIRGGIERIVIEDGAANNRITNCDIALDHYGVIPGAWQGGSAEGELLYRVMKYVTTGRSSSADKSITFRNPGPNNQILHNYIHDGVIGIQFLSRGDGKTLVNHNIFERNNSIGMSLVDADVVEAVNNRYSHNNIGVRLQDLSRAGKQWTGTWCDSFFDNPEGCGGAFFGHSFDASPPAPGITANIFNNTITGGRAGLSFPRGYPAGERHDNVDGARPHLYPEPGPDDEDMIPENEYVNITVRTSHNIVNSGAEGEIHVEWILRWGTDGRRTLDSHRTNILPDGSVILTRSFPLDVAPNVEHTLETRVENPHNGFTHLASHTHNFTVEQGELQITITGEVNVDPGEGP